MSLRFGLVSPIVTLVPGRHAPWEVAAGPDELARIAREADRLGYHHLSCSEHAAIPRPTAETRGGRYYDPAATLGFLASITERIRLLTHVVVLPYHHPLAVAKRYATLDVLSRGRVILGVGVGSLAEEFQLLGVEFEGRGTRYEDALRALRAGLAGPAPAYAGPYYRFSDFILDPAPVQERVPIWIGGRSRRSLRRALVFGDGWDPFGLSLEDLEDLLRQARAWPEWGKRAEPFDLALAPERPFDVSSPAGVEKAVGLVDRYRRAGATVLNLRFRSSSLEHFLEQLDIFQQKVAAVTG